MEDSVMPDIDSHIFSVALSFFLLIGAANLMIEQLITFVKLCKKLKATLKSEYSIKTGKLKAVRRTELKEPFIMTPKPQTAPAARQAQESTLNNGQSIQSSLNLKRLNRFSLDRWTEVTSGTSLAKRAQCDTSIRN
jgi:hypothetical protein